MDTLYEAVMKQAEKKTIRFHMPGHKGKGISGLDNAAGIDFTEIGELDNLHYPNGCIAYSEELMAEACGAARSFFIVNGGSAGIISAILAFTVEGGSVVCARNSHISLFKGLCLSGASPAYVMPQIISEYGICGGVDPMSVEEALIRTENASAVFITSPTFEGFTSDIAKIAETTHKHGAKLIVDEAHGPHFKFGSQFPKTALEQGADVVIQSWHKTLTAFGQAAVVHIGKELGGADADKLKFSLSVMQTTSPSYMIMASIDRTRELLQKNGAVLFEEYERDLNYLRGGLSSLKGVRLISCEVKGNNGVLDFDTGKIVLYIKGGGKRLDKYLRELGIFSEMSSFNHVVLMTSFADEKKDYEALIKAAASFDARITGDIERAGNSQIIYRIPEMALTPKDSVKRRGSAVPISEASGKISADFIVPYPPGIPLIVPGEVISEEVADFCIKARGGIEINGIIDDKYLKVLE